MVIETRGSLNPSRPMQTNSHLKYLRTPKPPFSRIAPMEGLSDSEMREVLKMMEELSDSERREISERARASCYRDFSRIPWILEELVKLWAMRTQGVDGFFQFVLMFAPDIYNIAHFECHHQNVRAPTEQEGYTVYQDESFVAALLLANIALGLRTTIQPYSFLMDRFCSIESNRILFSKLDWNLRPTMDFLCQEVGVTTRSNFLFGVANLQDFMEYWAVHNGETKPKECVQIKPQVGWRRQQSANSRLSQTVFARDASVNIAVVVHAMVSTGDITTTYSFTWANRNVCCPTVCKLSETPRIPKQN